MESTTLADWDPLDASVRLDPLAAYDRLRETCPAAYSEFLGWSLFRHADLMRVLLDPATFSNEVSRHVSVPNAMDPPRHAPYRRMIEPYFSEPRMRAFEPTCVGIAERLLEGLSGRAEVEWMEAFASHFAVRAQCAFLGWPDAMGQMLRGWVRENQAAVTARDRDRLAALAREFTEAVRGLLSGHADRPGAAQSITDELARERVEGRPLHERELVSILRNWTAGEVGTLSAALGILAHHLARDPELQQRLRAEPDRIAYAIEEILRIDGPLVSNRRVTTRPVEFHGRQIPAGATVTILWVAANRDGRVFEDPAAFRWERDHSQSLLYGAGIHVCPGAPLARLQLRIAVEQMLARTRWIGADADAPPRRAVYPAGGWSSVPLKITWR